MKLQIRDIPDESIAPRADAASLRRDFVARLYTELAKFPGVATRNDCYVALAHVVRDHLLHRWVRSARTFLEGQHRTVIYLSAEYLLGPQLGNNLLALGIEAAVREAMEASGLSLDDLIEQEEEPGLGNGGLGRLAACFMDSLATLDVPAIGHGLRYEFGIFDQEIQHGWQVERTDRWLRLGNPWEVRRYEIELPVGFGGETMQHLDADGRWAVHWVPERVVVGVPHDTPVAGYGTDNTNFLRLWQAVAAEDFDFDAFNKGEYWRAVQQKTQSETLTKVLYPNDSSLAGKQLRLEQQYFFVSCALQDCVRILLQRTTIDEFGDKYAIQLNDTHPALAVPELMRLLVDVHDLSWDDAWAITTQSIAYTNHTLLPEALETWPLPLFGRLLPRHLEIIYEINARFLDVVRARFPGDEDRVRRMSIIDERGEKSVRMAFLATVASHRVNGVAEMHSRLLRETVLRDFAELWPEKFTNVTNGVTPRRFVALANPGLARLIDDAIGEGWLRHLDRLRELEPFAEDAAFRERWRAVKLANKESLSSWLLRASGRGIDTSAMLDCQCKRIHEYKRQHLAGLYIVSQLLRARRGEEVASRTCLFAGKAAPGYWSAKLIIRFLHGIGAAIDQDPVARRRLQVVFFPDFNVKNAQRIYPAADLSEQISTAGKEASGTGNMKFALNGALTIGTLDGANVEIREEVGAENFFLFGKTAEEIAAMRDYRPGDVLRGDPELADVLGLVASGELSGGDADLFLPLVRTLVDVDPYFVLADFRAYAQAQDRVNAARADVDGWTRSSILNTARMGTFSSDRSIRDYVNRVWGVNAVAI